MKTPLTRIAVICAINLLLNYLLLFPLGLLDYMEADHLAANGWAGLVVSLIPAASVLLFYKLVDRSSLRLLGFSLKKSDFMFSVWSIVLTAALFLFTSALFSAAGILSGKWNWGALASGQFYGLLALLLLSWLAGAFYEELLFRGYFAANLRKVSRTTLYGISSLIFALFHLFRGVDVVTIVILAVMSCMFLFIYLKSGSLLPCVSAHLIFNFANSHLIGSSEIALLSFTGDSPVMRLILLAAYLAVHLLLAKAVYGRKQAAVMQEVPQ